MEFGEWLCTNVLKKLSHRHFVFSIPKILHRHFLYDRWRPSSGIRYYGWYSNVLQGKRFKGDADGDIPYLIESDRSSAAYRKSWAKLIRKIYEVAPLICPKCRSAMRIISFVEDQEIIKTILHHFPLDSPILGDPIYPWEAYI